MDRDAIERLIEAVEAGDDGAVYTSAKAVFPPDQTFVDTIRAHEGSLDGAKALHEAVLPEHDWYGGWTTGERRVSFSVWPRDAEWEWGDSTAEIPARAWLLSILRTLASRDQT